MATHHQVANAWFNQTGKHRQGFRMFYDGPAIFSHGRHFMIANIVWTPSTGHVVLYTNRDYSVSTAKHKSIVRRACGYKYFTVPHVNPIGAGHFKNVWWMQAQAKESLEKAKRARVYKQMHLDDAERWINEANEYAKAFNVPLDEVKAA